MTVPIMLDSAPRRRSPATVPGYSAERTLVTLARSGNLTIDRSRLADAPRAAVCPAYPARMSGLVE
jgi:hypothetical protein